MRDDGLVMRSVFLNEKIDAELRQLAFELKTTKSELIRLAISNYLKAVKNTDVFSSLSR